MSADESLAKKRFFAITAVRFVGVILAMTGALMLAGKIGGLQEMTAQALGLVLLLVGLFDVVWMPRILARRWRTAD